MSSTQLPWLGGPYWLLGGCPKLPLPPNPPWFPPNPPDPPDAPPWFGGPYCELGCCPDDGGKYWRFGDANGAAGTQSEIEIGIVWLWKFSLCVAKNNDLPSRFLCPAAIANPKHNNNTNDFWTKQEIEDNNGRIIINFNWRGCTQWKWNWQHKQKKSVEVKDSKFFFVYAGSAR